MRGIMELLLYWGSGGLLATLMLISTNIHRNFNFIRGILPPEVYTALNHYVSIITSPLQNYITKVLSSLHEHSVIIKQFNNDCHNDCFEAVQYYISSKSEDSAKVQELFRPKNTKNLTYTVKTNQPFEETYQGIKVKWSLHNSEAIHMTSPHSGSSRGCNTEQAYYQVLFMERYKRTVKSSYIPHVIKIGDEMKSKLRKRFLYTNRSSVEYTGSSHLWTKVAFSHSSTFDTIALDPVLKQDIKTDLIKYLNRQEYYERVGKTWKRGYLLYGPPGTGKTSLIAAIANFLEFDIYDLELSEVFSNSQLRKLLLSTSSKSVIIIEDIDCSVDLSDRSKQMSMVKADERNQNRKVGSVVPKMKRGISLSGVLNFADGLWSSCGEEKLLIFTTNHKDKLDQALLRPGRMDKHIHLSFCQIESFKILMKNYLGTDQHKLVKEVEEVLPLVMMTPADVAEIFMGVEDDMDKGMKNVIEAMKKRLQENEHRLAIEEEKDGSVQEPPMSTMKSRSEGNKCSTSALCVASENKQKRKGKKKLKRS